MPLTETMKIGLHREAWKYFQQNFERIPRRMEFLMEVLLTTKVYRIREQYSQQPWQHCIHSWNVSFHASSSRGLWMDMSGEVAEIHMRTDTKNLVTTARTVPLPEQKETIHMISMLRNETCSGRIHDLSHISTQNCLAVCLTKLSAKADNLITAVQTVRLLEVNVHPNFQDSHVAQGILVYMV